jgi:hypothetical protein
MNVKQVDFSDPDECKLYDQHVLNTPTTFVQQSTKWALSIADIDGDTPAFFYIELEDSFLGASMYLYEGQPGSILCSNVQAPTLGTFCDDIAPNGPRKEMYTELIEHICTFAEQEGCITVSLTTNPFNDENTVVSDVFNPDCGIKSFIQTISIDEYFDADGNITFNDYNRNSDLSRNIKNAYKNSFEAEVCTDITVLEEWYEEIHSKRIKEVGGTPLPKDLFMNSFEKMKENILFFIALNDSDLAGGVFCAYTENGILENMMLSSDSNYFNQGVNYFLIDQLLRWCNKNGIAHYDWQSSNPPNGGVYRFKKKWGSDEQSYNHYTRILDTNTFTQLQQMGKEAFSAYPNHFLAPYHTLVKDEYTVETKDYVSNLS